MTSSGSPAPLECQSLQFRQLCKLQTVHDNSKNVYKNRTNLVATCNAYGLIFVGEKSGIRIIISGKIYENCHNFNAKNVLSSYIHRNIPLPSPPTHIDVNSDQKLLGVTFNFNETPVLRVYDIESFFTPTLTVKNEVRLSSVPKTRVNDLLWNPVIPCVLACCISDGTMTIYTFGDGSRVDIKGLPKESNATCACWSPKGKQIVVGNINGYLTQFTPELKAMKNYPPPSGIFNKACTITSLKWLSPFQFIGVYTDQEQCVTSNDEIKVCIVVVNTPKNAPITYINYEDICYSSGSSRPNQFYFIHIPQWNVVFVASANAVEVGVLGLSPEENLWYQWNLDESARVVLPMIKADETFPVGVAVDFSSQIQTPIGNQVLPMPVFTILNDEGLLCLYLVNNFVQNILPICIKSNPVPNTQYFVSDDVSKEVQSNEQAAPQVAAVAPTAPATGLPTSFAAPQITAAAAAVNIPQMKITSSAGSFPASTMLNPLTVNANLNNVMSSMMPNVMMSNAQNVMMPNVNINVSSMQPKPASQFVSVSMNQKPVQQPEQQPTIPLTPRVAPEVKQDIQKITQIPATIKYPPTTPQPQVIQTPVEDANQKAINLQKQREEALKKLKKRANTFESEIQEFKQLTANIPVQTNDRPCDKIIPILEAKNKKLKELNEDVRNEIDNLKTSIIEVTACIKEIKSKQFLLANPGYRSLSSADTLDPESAASLKNIERNIHYVHSQIEIADKKLDEMWFKFCENTPESTTKIPKLENIYRTIVIQQKIVKVRKLEMQSLEKKLNEMRHRMSQVHPASNNSNNEYSNKSYDTSMSKEDQALVDLTKKVLNLNFGSKTLDPSTLTEKCVREYAKRFHLSNNKQLKLQELHSTHTVNYVRSTKLERLKKKSLIILSKSTSVPEEVEVKEKRHPNEVLRQQLISPVSSDDGAVEEVPIPVALVKEKVISSTPVKSGSKVNFNLEATFNEEPSVIDPVPQTNQKYEPEVPNVILSLPSSISAFRVNKPEVEVVKPTTIVAVPDKPANKENIEKPTPVSSAPLTFNLLNRPFQISSSVSNTAVTSAPSSSLFFGMKISTAVTSATSTSGSFFGGLKLAPSTTSSMNLPLSSAIPSSGSSLFGQNFSSSAVSNPLKDVTAGLNVAPKNEPNKLPLAGNVETTSLFGTKLSQSTEASVVSSASIAGDKPIDENKTPAVPSSLPALVSISVPSTAAQAPIMTQSSIFGKPVAEIPAAPVAASTSASILGSAMFGKATSSSGDSINFGSIFSSSSSIFGTKPVAVATATVTPSLTTTESDVFNSFSFASGQTASGVTISEITTETTPEEVVSSVAPTTASAIDTFSFANIASSTISTPTVPSEVSVSVSATVTPTSSPVYVAPATPVSATTAPVLSTPPSTPPASTTAFAGSFFGGLSIGATTTTASSTSAFGKPTGGSIFGGNIFSQKVNTAPTTSAESKPIFGTGAPLFGQSSTANQENKSIFGQAAGNANQENKSIFGQASGNVANQENKNLFNQPAAPENKSIFGIPQNANANQENKSLFGQPQGGFQSGTGSMFGTGGSSLFGGTNTFSGMAATTQTNTFGSSSGSLFGSSGFANNTANASFQGTAGGFGSPTSFGGNAQSPQGSAGFGSPPAFSSVFNKSGNQFSTFGSAPTFGTSPAFGNSPTKLFGQNAPAMGGTFGNASQQPTSFENIANENTIGFGNLAQQQQSPGFGSPPSFGAAQSPPSFGSSGFGGQSFSSWR